MIDVRRAFEPDSGRPMSGSNARRTSAEKTPMADLTREPALTATTEVASEGYRPLSLMALVGFLLSLLFVACVLVGGLAAFGARHSNWLVVWLVVALVGGWVAALAMTRPVLGTVGLAVAGLTTLVGLFGLVTCSATSPWLLPW